MRRLQKFLKENKILTSEMLDNATYSISANRGGIKLEGTCSSNKLEGSILSKNGKPLYTINENCDEMSIIRKLDEFSQYFDDAASFSQDDLEREDPEKELLLDDTDTTEEVDGTLAINSIEDVVRIMRDVIDGAVSIGYDFSEDIKSAYYGTISELYNTIDNLIEISKYTNNEVKESIAVPAKTDFIDDAINGISQACVQLRNSEEYKKLIGILEDVKSELIVSRE